MEGKETEKKDMNRDSEAQTLTREAEQISG